MSGIEDMINGVLSDPEQMKKLTAMAQSIMGASGGEGTQTGSAPSAAPDFSGMPNLSGMPDFSKLGNLFGGLPKGFLGKAAKGLLGGFSGGKGGGAPVVDGGDKAELLKAMSPWLSEKRREKLERSAQMAKFLKVGVGVFLKSGGGK